MAKLTLPPITSLGNTQSAIGRFNDNYDLIEDALENTLSRDGTAPNEMDADFDMNSYDILNVGDIYAPRYFRPGVELVPGNVSGLEGDFVERAGDTMTGPLTWVNEEDTNDTEWTMQVSTSGEATLWADGNFDKILSLNPGTASEGNTGQTITGRFRYSMPIINQNTPAVVSSGGTGVTTGLVVVDNASDVTLQIRASTGSVIDFDVGNFFSVMQRGAGRVTLEGETGGVILTVPAGYIAATRDQSSVISATYYQYDDGDQYWVVSGDLATDGG
jgi:hypothetical protein